MQRAHCVRGHEVGHNLERKLGGQMLPEPRVFAGEGDVAVNLGEGGEEGDEGAVAGSVNRYRSDKAGRKVAYS